MLVYLSHYFNLSCPPTAEFLHGNYKQSLSVISEQGAELQAYMSAHNLEDHDFQPFLIEECNYLAALKKPCAENEVDVAYVQALEALEMAE